MQITVTTEEKMIHDNAWTTYGAEDLEELEKLSADYIDFLNNGKTERECAAQLVEMAKGKGYRDLADIIANGEKLASGDKVYAVNMDKMVMMLNIGDDIIGDGMNILGAHIDSPRLDIKLMSSHTWIHNITEVSRSISMLQCLSRSME